MKRPLYEIHIDGQLLAKKASWNSALAESGKLAAAMFPSGKIHRSPIARVELDRWTTRSGKFTWTHDNGRVVTVEIELANPHQLNQ